MINEFENEENVVSSFGEEQINGGGYRKNSTPKVILGVILAALILLGWAFACTNLKYIFMPNKMKFLNYLDEDIKYATDLYKENEFMKFVTNKNPKVMDVNVNAMGNEISVTSVINKDSVTLKLNNSNDKYYLIDFNNLDKLYENLGIEGEVPADIDAFSKKELEKLKEFGFDCYNIFKNSLTNDDFIITKDNKILVNDKEIEADSVELKITETKLMEIAKLLLEELRNSEVIDIVFESVDDMGMSKEEFIESLDKTLANYDEEMEELKERIEDGSKGEEYIIYRMYNKNGIVARELITGYGEEINTKLAFITNDDYYEYKAISQNLFSGESTEIISDAIVEEKDITYHNIKFITQYNKRQYVPGNSSLGGNPFASVGSYEYVPVTEEETFKIKAENDNTKFTLVGIDGVDVTIDIDDKINIDISASGIDLNINIVENKKMTTEKLIKDGAVVINDLTKEEFEEEMEQLEESLETPKVNTMQSRSQIVADIRTGEQIGKAILIWETDGHSGILSDIPTEYTELEGIGDYIGESTPYSLKDAKYYAVKKDGKIKVAIAKDTSELINLNENETYDGTGAGWVYNYASLF